MWCACMCVSLASVRSASVLCGACMCVSLTSVRSASNSGFGEPREGDDRFVEEVDLSDQDVGALTPGRDLTH